jgi:LPS O-antigen subunit length determinant protein (WzzB/FepE family)
MWIAGITILAMIFGLFYAFHCVNKNFEKNDE